MNQRSSVYPNAKESVYATLIVLAISLVAGIILSFIPGEYGTLIQYTVPMMLAYLYLQNRQRSFSDPIPSYTNSVSKPGIYPPIIIGTMSILVINSFLGAFIPMPQFFIDIFEEFMGEEGIYTFLTVAVAAPILEELIFRGVILNGLLKNYSPLKAIMISSLLFGLLHLNPWQFIAAFNLGVLAGWVFYRTGSIIPAIAVHFVNNGSASIISLLEDGETDYNIPPLEIYGSTGTTLTMVFSAIALLALCIFLLNRTLPVPVVEQNENESDQSSFNVSNDEEEVSEDE
ncbi:MAG: type II CAAX endopeptidase family protein [Bacteroidota bacterium]